MASDRDTYKIDPMGCFLLFAILAAVLAGCSASPEPPCDSNPLGPYADRNVLIAAVESGEAPAVVLVDAVRLEVVSISDLTPEAVADYMEALACERMLDRVPASYMSSPDVVLSYEIVFEDMENVFNNWDGFKVFLKRVYHADMS